MQGVCVCVHVCAPLWVEKGSMFLPFWTSCAKNVCVKQLSSRAPACACNSSKVPMFPTQKRAAVNAQWPGVGRETRSPLGLADRKRLV